jgi:hypothetical protein
MLISAVLSFILYLLVFFRLRGNISLSVENKIGFRRRPKVRVGRTSDGTYIVTDDRRVESHLTTVAKHMLWYPLAYALLVFPMAASRFSTFSGVLVPFPVTIVTAAIFMLHGFVNTLLFCTTRNILPGSWRQRFGLGTTWDTGRGDADLYNQTNATWQFTGFSTAGIGSASKGMTSVVLSAVRVEKGVEIHYDEAQPSPSYPKVGSPSSPTSPTPLPRAYGGGGHLVDTHKHHTQQPPFLTPRDARSNLRYEVYEDDGDCDFDAGVDPALNATTIEPQAPPQPLGDALEVQESSFYRPAPGLQAPASVHRSSTTQLMVNTDKRQSHSLSISTSVTTVNSGRLSRAS